jgi:FlgD Ig-like domain
VSRLPKLLLVLVLLGATAAAFAVTERLKLERSPITGTVIDPRVFSPVCECADDAATISFILRRPATVTVDLLDTANDSVRSLVSDREEESGRVTYVWDGRDDADQLVEDGRYRPRVQLEEHGRTIVMPVQIRVDKTKPRIRLRSVLPRVFSPDRDGNRDFVRARWITDEPAQPLLLVDGKPASRPGEFRTSGGQIDWYGRVGGRTVRPGVYELRVRAIDRAGNRASSRRRVRVLVRFIALARDRIEVVAGRRFALRVSTDADRYRWRFAGHAGRESGSVLGLDAPDEPGRYRVYVRVGRWADAADVVVTAPDTP